MRVVKADVGQGSGCRVTLIAGKAEGGGAGPSGRPGGGEVVGAAVVGERGRRCVGKAGVARA